MPRAKRFTKPDLAAAALAKFWADGFCATSIDDLVRATGASRAALYSEFGGKRGLFLACFDAYGQTVVTPAFSRVEAPAAGWAEIRQYFLHQIDAAAAIGLPGPGCFVANAATEVAPHDQEVRSAVLSHNARLQNGFAAAIRREAPERIASDAARVGAAAEACVVFATGLWNLSRCVTSADPLRRAATSFCVTYQGTVT